MQKNKPKSEGQLESQDQLTTQVVFGDIRDPKMTGAAMRIDAASDREWLAQHPDQLYRLRPASVRELAGSSEPVGTQIVAIRGPDGTIVRASLVPKKKPAGDGGGSVN